MKTLGTVLLAVGVTAVGAGFVIQSQVNKTSAVNGMLGLHGGGSPAPWFVAGAGILAVIVGAVLLVQSRGAATGPRIGAGWHDDPESPTLLRYHDGERWTERTADKT